MRRSILTQKNWAIFLVAFTANIIIIIVFESIRNSFDFKGSNSFELQRAILFFLTMPFVLSYPFLVERRLREILKEHQKFIQVPSGNVAVISVVFLMSYLLAPMSAVFGVLMIVSFLTLFSIPARQLRSIELRRNAGFREYIADTFSFTFWFLGVWWLQPRLNRITRKKIIIES